MTNTPHQPDQQHIDAVLEPVAPGSQYDFIEIDSEPIEFALPWTQFGSFLSRSVALLRQGVRSQWKFIILVMVLAFVAEGVARKIEPRFLHRIYNQTQTGGHPLAMNGQGFRGEPVVLPKPKNTTRILTLGDSVTFGTGVAWEDTWPAQLGFMLNTSSKGTQKSMVFDVINAGYPGLDLSQIELEYSTRWTNLAPDQAVVMITGNMISFAYARRNRDAVTINDLKARNPTPEHPKKSSKDKALDIYSSFALPGVLTIGMEHLKFAIGLERHDVNPDFPTGVMFAHGYTQNGIETDQIELAWALFRSQLESLVETLQSDGIPVIVIYSPPRFLLSDHRIDNLKWVDTDRFTTDPVDQIEKICASLNIEFINPLPALRETPSPTYILSDYTHFDHNGHHTLAQLIAQSIKP